MLTSLQYLIVEQSVTSVHFSSLLKLLTKSMVCVCVCQALSWFGSVVNLSLFSATTTTAMIIKMMQLLPPPPPPPPCYDQMKIPFTG